MLDTKNRDARDLIEGRRSRDRTLVAPTSARVALLICLVAIAAFFVGRSTSGDEPPEPAKTDAAKTHFDGGSPQAMAGEMVLSPVDRSGDGRRATAEGQMSGTITLDADGPHHGTVRLRGSTSPGGPDNPSKVYHGWGTIDAVLDDVPCTGTYAWTYRTDGADSGGSLHLRCDDGRLLAGRLTVSSVDQPLSGDGSWRIGVRVHDGFYLERHASG